MTRHTTDPRRHPRIRRRRQLLGRVGGLLAAVLALGLIGPAAAGALNPERHYEMASPIFKGGAGAIGIEAVATNGESVMFASAGNFAGTSSGFQTQDNYLAHRGASEWETLAVQPPALLDANSWGGDVSPTLDRVWALASPGRSKELTDSSVRLLVHSTSLPDTPANWEQVGEFRPVNETAPVAADYEDSSLDLCHVLFSSRTAGTNAFVPEAINNSGAEQDYVLNRCGNSSPALSLVALNNQNKIIDPACNGKYGGGGYNGGFDSLSDESTFNAMSRDGEEVFFTTCLTGHDSSFHVPHQLYLRLAASRTLEISRPLDPSSPFGGCVGGGVPGEVPCDGALARPSADFQGASEDGTTAYFTTAAALAPSDTDASNDLYRATIGCPASDPGCSPAERQVTSLTQVSHTFDGTPAEVQGVLRVAPDGRRVYYVSTGDLLDAAQRTALERAGRPLPRAGALNLYVYDEESGASSFVADLCTGYQLSGSVEDAQCPNASETDVKLLQGNEPQSQTAGVDGRFLVFSTVAQLVPGDTDSTRDVYRYDAQTEALQRVSLGEAGYAANGNINPPGEPGAGILPVPRSNQNGYGSRAVSEDGSRIVFTSVAPLSPEATNGGGYVYEWHAGAGGGEGSVSLIAAATPTTAVADGSVNDAVISPDGSSIFFVTEEGLVPQDTDGLDDVYDARLGEGFAPAAAGARPCQGDACQGALSEPAPLLVPGSASQVPGENVVSTPTALAAKAKPSARGRAGKLAGALRACTRLRPRAKQKRCERRAHNQFGAGAHRSTRKHGGGHR